MEQLLLLAEQQAAADAAGTEPAWTFEERALLDVLAAKAGAGQ